jgi:hypothetical protein
MVKMKTGPGYGFMLQVDTLTGKQSSHMPEALLKSSVTLPPERELYF